MLAKIPKHFFHLLLKRKVFDALSFYSSNRWDPCSFVTGSPFQRLNPVTLRVKKNIWFSFHHLFLNITPPKSSHHWPTFLPQITASSMPKPLTSSARFHLCLPSVRLCPQLIVYSYQGAAWFICSPKWLKKRREGTENVLWAAVFQRKVMLATFHLVWCCFTGGKKR